MIRRTILAALTGGNHSSARAGLRRAHALLAAIGLLRFRKRHSQRCGDPQRRKIDACAKIRAVFRSESRVSMGPAHGFARTHLRRRRFGRQGAPIRRPSQTRQQYSNLPELAAQAIAFDSHDNLYVGTSPDGKIYKVTPEGQKSVFFDPKSKYIWALAVDKQGTLFAGTGDNGKIFAVTPDGKGDLFYQSDERHARSLAFDSKGNLLVGTDPDGLILRIEVAARISKPRREPARRSSFTRPTRKKSLRCSSTPAAKLYAAAIGEKQRPPATPQVNAIITPQPTPPLSAQPGAATLSIQAAGRSRPRPFSFFPSTTGGSAGRRDFPRRHSENALDFAR